MDNKMIEDLSNILNNKDEIEKLKSFMGVDDSFFNDDNNSNNSASSFNQNSQQYNNQNFGGQPNPPVNDFSNMASMFSNINLDQMQMFQGLLGGLSGSGGGGNNSGNNSGNKSDNLLLSLKPFLSNERQSKVDMALNFMKMIQFMPMINNNLFGGSNNNENK